ncbi:MAG: cytochrome P450 [Chloroflexi bacterium]|nr:cytochrome P450 [Chloroflexota bacterium]
MTRTIETTAPVRPPRMPGIPYLTDNVNMLNDPLRYLVQGYRELGPVFRVRMGFTEYTVLAGLEANLFLQREAEQYLTSETLFGGMARQFNTDVMLTMLDGEPHRHMRKVMRPGFSRSAIAPHVAKVLDVVREFAETLKPGDDVAVFDSMRRLVCNEIGLITTGVKPGDRYQDILTFLAGAMNVEVVKVWPRVMLSRPSWKQAKANMLALGKEILDLHRADPPREGGRTPDMIDDLLASVRPDGDPFTEDDLISFAVGPYIAGIDTLASTLAFFVYAIAKHPEIRARAKAEVDALFDAGTPDLNDFRKLEFLHAAAIENLRRFPATPFTPRAVKHPFTFAGYDFAVGTEVMFANGVTHMLDEYYPDPLKFDPERHLTGEAPPPGVFAPYTLGPHTCLGAGMAEGLALITMAGLLRHTKLELPNPDYTVKIRTMPLPNPGQSFRVKVADKPV